MERQGGRSTHQRPRDAQRVPKIKRAGDIYTVETLLDQIEANHDIENTIGIETLIEETEALQNVDEIAATGDRLEALIFGPGDYSASQGVQLKSIGAHGDEGNYPGDIWHYVRNQIVVAARSNDLDAIDGPYGDFSDPEGYREECVRSFTLGDAMEEGTGDGQGAVRLDGEMIDEASVRSARHTLERARQIGMID